MIHYFSEGVSFGLSHTSKQQLSDWLASIVTAENHHLVMLNFIFCTDSYLHAKNVAFLEHDTLTDVITFDYSDEQAAIEGEIYISIDRVVENAKVYGVTFEAELYRVMVHGLLHLLGYDDLTAAGQQMMRQKEGDYLELMLAE